MFKKSISILLLILIQISAFTQLYASTQDINYSNPQKKFIQTEKSSSVISFDAFENEGENEDDTDFHVHYFLLPISFILNYGYSTDINDDIPSIRITEKLHTYHCPIFITTRQILI
jgi:hypothetical protein